KNLRHYVRVLDLLGKYQRDGGAGGSTAQRARAAEVISTVRSLVSTVHLSVNEPGAAVFVDDEPRGTTPLAEPLLVDLGRRRIRVSKAGFKDQVVAQDLTGGSEVTFNLVLETDVHEGRLAVTTEGGATISIDGSAVGQDRWEGRVASGPHAIR